jgi:hypothetical protein
MKQPCLVLLGLLGLALGISSLGCRAPSRPEAQAPPWFEDVTDAVGLDFTHDAGPVDGRYFLPQVVGSGAAVFDFDGDGLLDVYLLNNGGPGGRPNALFKQLPGGRFKDVSRGSGLDVAGFGMGVAIGDVNNDGRPDVLLTEYRRVRLFLNQGGTFRDVTREAGLDNPFWATSAAFFDYDRDGRLDLVVVNYVDYDPSWPCAGSNGARDYCNPNQFAGSVVKLFRNLGEPGGVPRFRDVTVEAGLGRLAGPGLGVVCLDLDGDGWPDIFVANDGQPNRLWINHKGKSFKEEAVRRGLAYNKLAQAQAGMGVAVGDVDGDELPDVLVTHLTEETHTLWRQGPPGLFRDRTAEAGLASPGWRGTGWGVVLADFNHDGALDLALVNGRVYRGPSREEATLGLHWSRYAERNQLFAGDGRGGFRDLSGANEALCGSPGVYRGLAVGDLNGDGALDLLVTAVAGRARLFRNVATARGHWLLVRAVEPCGRDSQGARVTVEAEGRRWVGWVNPGQSYLCSHDPRVHFGLGQAERIREVRVLWPNGRRERFRDLGVDREVRLERGKGEKVGP